MMQIVPERLPRWQLLYVFHGLSSILLYSLLSFTIPPCPAFEAISLVPGSFMLFNFVDVVSTKILRTMLLTVQALLQICGA